MNTPTTLKGINANRMSFFKLLIIKINNEEMNEEN